MRGKDRLFIRETPEVEVMDLLDKFEIINGVVNFDCLDAIGCVLHKVAHAVFENGHCREHDQDREQEGADRVRDSPVGLNVNDYSCRYDSKALDHIADHVDYGCPNIKVLCRVNTLHLLYDRLF